MAKLKSDRISDQAKWCVYKTTHPTGFYYIGKGQTAKVLSGEYKGSGTRLKAAWLFGGKPREEWTSIVIETFDCEDEAFNLEKSLVTFELLCDPFCMNSITGGAGMRWSRLSADTIARAKKKQSDARKGKPLTAETKLKMSKKLKGQKKSEEHKRKISEGQKGNKRGSWYNNGSEQRLFHAGAVPPGFTQGRLK